MLQRREVWTVFHDKFYLLYFKWAYQSFASFSFPLEMLLYHYGFFKINIIVAKFPLNVNGKTGK